tara:strand:+ start:1113 stop:1268 length:156 start_codon:yes stop_codon:yes gene_type:complete
MESLIQFYTNVHRLANGTLATGGRRNTFYQAFDALVVDWGGAHAPLSSTFL